jgi:hypothetical protein
MTLYLCREEKREDGIFSELRDESGKILFHTAEHAYNSEPKIPNGTYKCVRGQHQLHGMTVPFSTFMLENVPNHTNILLHVGNFPQIDSDGCILLGLGIAQSDKGQMITQSKQAFAEFIALTEGLDSFDLVVS